ncbi:TIGR02444 family protein [Pseudomonas sp. ICMP22404]|uniref:TIGR02444 family protein n=1 Tax=Pseudomonas TaxID=286 RepID=UPI00111BA599|nr:MULTISPECIES: TIGR02444 family protein [Pseudomonas]MCI0992701.1 TIGR02444 family protein [Pseudomonas corrugata]NUT65440.1 TIGR02444 family protein [Pseudomonas corrugata]TNF85346.1 TIGR02444 family protein [Pseudomonas sp. ICMP22404]
MSSDLWSFSLDLYARPGVEQSCLALQEAGASVCLLLCGLWLEQRGVACDAQRLQQLRMLAEPWDKEVVQPLRTLRTQWKAEAVQDTDLTHLREQVKKLELQAERCLLERLEAVAAHWPEGQQEDSGRWLQGLAANAGPANHDALHQLRVAVSST